MGVLATKSMRTGHLQQASSCPVPTIWQLTILHACRSALDAAWRRLAVGSNWAQVAAARPQLADVAFQQLLQRQPIFAAAAECYGVGASLDLAAAASPEEVCPVPVLPVQLAVAPACKASDVARQLQQCRIAHAQSPLFFLLRVQVAAMLSAYAADWPAAPRECLLLAFSAGCQAEMQLQ